MTGIIIATLALMGTFYCAYFVKQIQQHRQGVQTMILGEGDKPQARKRQELALKITTFTLPAVEVVSIWWQAIEVPLWVGWLGVGITTIGVAFFIVGMVTMRGSWRAGIPEKRETNLVTHGIYAISRNPAFVGFDLMYIGILCAFPNIIHALFVVIGIILFHLQICQEEIFLREAFGDEYANYAHRVCRYIGRQLSNK